MKALCTSHVRFRNQSLSLPVRGTQLIMIGSHQPVGTDDSPSQAQSWRADVYSSRPREKANILSKQADSSTAPQQLSGVRCSDIDSHASMNSRAVHYRQHEGCKDRQGHVDVHDGRAEPLLPVAYVMMIIP